MHGDDDVGERASITSPINGTDSSPNISNIKHSDTLSVAHLNVRSIRTGFDEFVNYIHEYGFDVIAITETWLTAGDHNDVFYVPGYRLVRADRDERGGGVAFYVKKTIRFRIIDIDFDSRNLFEYMNICFKHDNENYLITCIYRPPSQNVTQFVNSVEDFFSQVVPVYDHVIFLGDINIDFLQNSQPKKKLLNIFHSFDLSQIINKPTRINLNQDTESLIDIIVIKNGLDCQESHTIPISDTITDHNLIYALFRTPIKHKHLCAR